jgi:polyhydroxyalkanoate synthase
MKPVTVATSLHDRELLAQIEAVDRFMANMHAYPGRTFGQLYHRFFRVNDLANGQLASRDGVVRIDRVAVPVLAIAGEGDGIAPVRACHHIGDLLDGVRLETAPGGHLGVLTGRAARRTTWKLIDGFLDEHVAKPPARPRARRAA